MLGPLFGLARNSANADGQRTPTPRIENGLGLNPCHVQANEAEDGHDADAAMLGAQRSADGVDLLRRADGEVGTIARTAHSLNGSCALFGATAMASMCRDPEASGATVDHQRMQGSLAGLDEELEQIAGPSRKVPAIEAGTGPQRARRLRAASPAGAGR